MVENTEANSGMKSLAAFCEEILSRHKSTWPPSEHVLAQGFMTQYSPKSLLGSSQVIEFSRRLGISASLAALPEGMHGLNCSMAGEAIILLKEKEEFPGSREHTFFHELREIMEYHFRDLGSPTLESTVLERHAEEFAVHVRMAQSFEMAKFFAESVEDIEARWKRVLGYVGIAAFMLVWCFGCALLPHLEDRFSRRDSSS